MSQKNLYENLDRSDEESCDEKTSINSTRSSFSKNAKLFVKGQRIFLFTLHIEILEKFKQQKCVQFHRSQLVSTDTKKVYPSNYVVSRIFQCVRFTCQPKYSYCGNGFQHNICVWQWNNCICKYQADSIHYSQLFLKLINNLQQLAPGLRLGYWKARNSIECILLGLHCHTNSWR